MRATLAAIAVVAGCSAPGPNARPQPDAGTTPDAPLFTSDTSDGDGAATISQYTYHADLKPIIEGRCANCHVEGGIGPFTMRSYEEVAPLKDLIADVIEHRTMPPFLPSPGCREYVFDPSLTRDQIDLVRDWARGGAPEGDPNSSPPPDAPFVPPPPDFDVTLEMPEAYTPQVRPDDYRCFVLDWPATTTSYITGFGVEPGDARVVHHIVAYHASPELAAAATALDDAEEGPGYTCFGGPLLGGLGGQAPWLGAWAPGGNGTKYPTGTGLPIEPGSRVVVQIHYNTLAIDPVPDKTKILFETAETVDKPAFFHLWASPTWLEGSGMPIPAGDPAVTHRFSLDPTLTTGGRSITLYSANLHMHLLGKEAWTYVIRRDGSTECLMQINNYDFSWQGGAGFVEPVAIDPGDRLAIECLWDNSMANQPIVDGQQITPEDRDWGEGTTDEMCLGIYYATVD